MAKCPKCGSEVKNPSKTWLMPKKGEKTGIKMGLYDCPSCNAKFRSIIETVEEAVSVKSLTPKIRIIQGELMQTLRNLREKIKTLETERANLMLEIEELKKLAESKVSALESEVSMLREELKSLRDLLGVNEKET
jgi:DNA repair exonuclease SbcCD ATPase subunit